MPRPIKGGYKAKRSKRTKFSKGINKYNHLSDKSGVREHRFMQVHPYRVKPEPFPRAMMTRAKFAAIYTLTTNAGSTAVSNTYRLNSLYEPDVTAGAASPTVVGWTQLNSIYGAQWVMGAKINVTFFDPSSDGGAIRCGVRLRIKGAGAVSGDDATGLAEQPMTYMAGLSDTGSQKKSFTLFVRPWTLMGLTKLEYMANSDLYAADLNANPNFDNCYVDVFALSQNGSVVGVRTAVRIIYYVKVYDRKYLTAAS